jgi:hypothetical protein
MLPPQAQMLVLAVYVGAQDIEVVVRHQVLLLFVKVDVAAREYHKVVVPVVGQSCLSYSKRRQHLLERASLDDVLLLLELSCDLRFCILRSKDAVDVHQGVEGVRRQVEPQIWEAMPIERGHQHLRLLLSLLFLSIFCFTGFHLALGLLVLLEQRLQLALESDQQCYIKILHDVE